MFEKPSQPSELDAIVRRTMPAADDETRALVTAVAGLLVSVAYADREFADSEQQRVHEVLCRIDGLPRDGAATITALLRARGALLSVGDMHKHTRTLREQAEPELRREVLEALLDVAASDGSLGMVETDLLRRTATALGLSADDYLAAQARYRDRISLLK